MKIKTYPNGHAVMDKCGAWYLVKVYKGAEVYDKIKTDDYKNAMEYFRAFCKIAKTA